MPGTVSSRFRLEPYVLETSGEQILILQSV